MEHNPLVRDGTHERVFVAELQPGDVTAFNEVVEQVERVHDGVLVHLNDGTTITYRNGGSTILVKTH